MNKQDAAQVLIVGAGPIGLATAILLARAGITVKIIDKNTRQLGQTYFSRALGLHARTLEVFDDMGIIQDILSKGRIINGIAFYIDGQRRAGISFRHLPSSYPFMLSIPQSDTQWVLEQKLNQLGVYVTRQTELQALQHTADGVQVTLATPSGEQQEHYQYLVGADGFRSHVREICGIPFDGEAYEESWILAESYLSRDFPSDEANVIISERASLAVVPMPDGKVRVTGPDLSSQSSVNELDLDTFSLAMQEMGALPHIRYQAPDQVIRFRVHKRLARQYAKDRVFLAGDAAHVHSPGGGQGLNTGVLDAYNLAWRLALVLKGLASPRLLEGYDKERRHAGAITVFGTDKAMQLLAPNRPALQKSLIHLALPWVMKSRYGKQLAANMSQIYSHYRHCFTHREQDYFNCNLALGDPLLRVVPPLNVAGDPLKVQPGNKFTVLLFLTKLSQRQIRQQLEALRRESAAFALHFQVQLISPSPLDCDVAHNEHLVHDACHYVHYAFGMNEAGLYIARPDGILAFRRKTEQLAQGLADFIADNLLLEPRPSVRLAS